MARETKHTPGKWTSTKATITYTQFNITAKDAFIGEVGGGLQSDDEIEANARIIAASPEMYEVLKFIYSSVDWSSEAWNNDDGQKHKNELESLIKKIEG